MRVRRATALTVFALGITLASGTVAQAHETTTNPAAPSMSSDMPGMSDMHGSAAAAVPAQNKPDKASNLQRAKLKSVYLEAKLDGASEVQTPGKPPVGDPKGSATGIVRVQGNKVTFAFSWKGISAPTLGHIHQGAAGSNGDVKVPLFTTPMPDGVTAASGAVTVSDPAIADALRANPADFYLNLHTKEFAGGAVRGQLSKLNKPKDLLGLLQGGGEKAFMSGDQEVPAAGAPAVGDPQGRAVSFIKARGTQVNYSFAWFGISPTLGHIHQGAAGTNGAVKVPLFTTAIPSTVFAVSGSVNGVDPALVKDIASHPSNFYANLHTAQFPGGAVRGQLFN